MGAIIPIVLGMLVGFLLAGAVWAVFLRITLQEFLVVVAHRISKIRKIVWRFLEPNYQYHFHNEIVDYQKALKNRLSVDVPPIWSKVEERFSKAIREATGVGNLYEYVARHLQGKKEAKILSLGSGACGNEFEGIAPLLSEQHCQLNLTCIDINSDILKAASLEASKRGILFTAMIQDANEIRLVPNAYDVIVAYSSLHHFQNVDHIASQINLALCPDGIFVTVDIPTKNGYRMWDETFEVVNSVWKIIPRNYKMDHTRYAVPTYARICPNLDSSKDSFECINSEAILPALRNHMEEVDFVPALSIARRFFDMKFGPNYDIRRPLDSALFEFIMNLDQYYIETGMLQPETFFGAYRKKI